MVLLQHVFVHHHNEPPCNHLKVNFLIEENHQNHNLLVYVLDPNAHKNKYQTCLKFHVPFNLNLRKWKSKMVRVLFILLRFLHLFYCYTMCLVRCTLLQNVVYVLCSPLRLYLTFNVVEYLCDGVTITLKCTNANLS